MVYHEIGRIQAGCLSVDDECVEHNQPTGNEKGQIQANIFDGVDDDFMTNSFR